VIQPPPAPFLKPPCLLLFEIHCTQHVELLYNPSTQPRSNPIDNPCHLPLWQSQRCTALHCTALHCTALHCTALHCTVLAFHHLGPRWPNARTCYACYLALYGLLRALLRVDRPAPTLTSTSDRASLSSLSALALASSALRRSPSACSTSRRQQHAMMNCITYRRLQVVMADAARPDWMPVAVSDS
jgi:hypothetical protein